MANFLNIAIYMLLCYWSIKLLKSIGIDFIVLFKSKVDHNIYFQNNTESYRVINTKDQPEQSVEPYRMRFNDKVLKNFLKHKPKKSQKQKIDYLDNIFDLI
jgi:hypothetical protein